MSNPKKSEQVKTQVGTRKKRVVSIVPVVEKAAEKCKRVGDNVAYPPFLMQYDARSEGVRAVNERVK